jgi:hypothetical protein
MTGPKLGRVTPELSTKHFRLPLHPFDSHTFQEHYPENPVELTYEGNAIPKVLISRNPSNSDVI